ncbi:MAG: penicillin-binding protein 2, partial [Patescibacteria group bacterium]|nr:penicillin-binding protein 2 [Patescibacteria group bacterium]
IINPRDATDKIVPILELDFGEVLNKLSLVDDPYEPLKKQVSPEVVEKLRALEIQGIVFARESYRAYPEKNMGGHILGFMGSDKKGNKSGKYGLEGYFDADIRGKEGYLKSERNPLGSWIMFGDNDIEQAVNGSDLVLTIDRSIQFTACEKLQQAVKDFDADGGTVIVMNPWSGAVLAMCSLPDFDPNNYSEVENISIYNNPAIFDLYEAGSVMKPITMAAALDVGEVTPESTYKDEGFIKFHEHTIKNSDGEKYGIQTMTNVLENSLNTGVVYVVDKLGKKKFREYLENFGFSAKTGIELDTEVGGNISSLWKRGEIYAATASFGQGISVTPLELVSAFGAIANGGKLMKPYIVDEIRKDNGFIAKTESKEIRQVISEKTARLLGGMLVSVVDNGHGRRAGVSGYFVAGKTGTAQVAKQEGGGYEEDISIGSFVGFAPVNDPKFVMLVKINNPKAVEWAENSAAPVFGQIAEFLLNYFKVPTER